MGCHICGKEAVDRCYTCGNLFCSDHGHVNCDHCETGIAAGDIRPDRVSASRLQQEQGRHAWWRPQQAEDYDPPSCHVCQGLARRVCRNCEMHYCPEHAGPSGLCQQCGRSSLVGVVCLVGALAGMAAIILWGFVSQSLDNHQRDLLTAIVGRSAIITIVYLVFAFSCRQLLVKASQPGWPGFVPVYNFMLLLKLAGRPMWWVLFYVLYFVWFAVVLLAASSVDIRIIATALGISVCLFTPALVVINIFVGIGLARNFGKHPIFGVGVALAWIIFLPMLAFGDAAYVGKRF